MQIHIQLIPISSPDQIPPGPDPPANIFHFTTGAKLKQIINSGCIKPTAAADMLAWENSGFSVDASGRITRVRYVHGKLACDL